ncbi:MAG: hypothetical protein ACREJD_04790 [Phycisphaerales bacterium]
MRDVPQIFPPVFSDRLVFALCFRETMSKTSLLGHEFVTSGTQCTCVDAVHHGRKRTMANETDESTTHLIGEARSGKARTAILLWLIGVPIPLIVLFFLIKSCVGG